MKRQRTDELATERGKGSAASQLTADSGSWDPFEFVDDVESIQSGDQAVRELRLAIQETEWELLYEYCFRTAVAKHSD